MATRRIVGIGLLVFLFLTPTFSLIHASADSGTFYSASYSISDTETADNSELVMRPLIVNPSIFPDMSLNDLIEKGYSGKNVTIAVLDTGIMYNDPRFDRDGDLSTTDDRVVTKHVSFVAGEPDYDLNGHGTHIAGLIAAQTCKIPSLNLTIRGIAPNVEIWSVKVLDREGKGDEISITQGLQFCLAHKNEIDIISISLGVKKNVENAEALQQLEESVKQCWDNGIVVVVSAGNYGDITTSETLPLFSINVPGAVLETICVGAMKEDGIADYSSIGPTPMTNYIKPDLVAPGSDLISTGKENGTFVVGISGTSFSTPIVAAGIALLIEAYGSRPNPNLVKAALVDSCTPLGYDMYEEGAGVPNFTRALSFLLSDSYDGVAVIPKNLEFPNFFDPEMESIPHNVHEMYSSVGVYFNYIKATIIVGKEPDSVIYATTDENISDFIRIYWENVTRSGQYVMGIDFVERIFSKNSLLLIPPGVYTGCLQLHDGKNIVARIEITVLISISSILKLWIYTIISAFVSILSIFAVKRIRKGKKEDIIKTCPKNVPYIACQCDINGDTCWVDPAYVKKFK